MQDVAPLPLPLDQLPESIRRFCDPAGPTNARTMAAKGLVPLKAEDSVCLLLQLSADKADDIAGAARSSLRKLPSNILRSTCASNVHVSFLHALAYECSQQIDLLEAIIGNNHCADATLEYIARSAPELLCERIAINEQRLLRAPKIIETLYKNPQMRMSTADRLIDLAVRNNIELTGIPSFKAHAEAIRGQAIPQPADAPLPSDELFKKTLAHDANDPEAVEQDRVEGTETVKAQFKPLSLLISELTAAKKIRLALVGSAAARALLIRDKNKQVAHAAVSSPGTTEAEAATFARSKEVGEDILRYIGNKRDWLRNYEVKRGLMFNPKTPIGIALRFLSHLRKDDLKQLARNKNVSAAIKSAARQRLEKIEKAGG